MNAWYIFFEFGEFVSFTFIAYLLCRLVWRADAIFEQALADKQARVAAIVELQKTTDDLVKVVERHWRSSEDAFQDVNDKINEKRGEETSPVVPKR